MSAIDDCRADGSRIIPCACHNGLRLYLKECPRHTREQCIYCWALKEEIVGAGRLLPQLWLKEAGELTHFANSTACQTNQASVIPHVPACV